VPEPPGFVEQRLFLRKKVETPLPIELLPGKEVWLHDLGEGGLSVSGSSRVEPGTATFLDFRFPDPNSIIEAAGVVAWCDSFGRVGVRFTRIKPDSTAALKRWLKSDQTPALDDVAETEPSTTPLTTLVSRAHFEISDLRAELASETLSPEAALKLIVERMAYHTRATGAAIALRDGNHVICRASTGNAPEIGVRLNVETGLSGECYRTGNIVSLADSEHDARVDAEVCKQLDFRSLLIVPVQSEDDDVVGVAEVFSSAPGNFEGGDVLLLSSIAELIGGIYDKNQLTSSPIERVAVVGQDAPQGEPAPAPFVPAGFEIADKNSGRNEFIAANEEQAPSNSIEHEFAPDRDAESNSSSWKTRRILIGALLAACSFGVGDYVNWRLIRPHPATPQQNRVSYQAPQSSVALAPQRQTVPQDSQQTPALATTNLMSIVSPVPSRNTIKKAVPSLDSVESHFSTGLAIGRQSEPVPVAPALGGSDQSPFRVNTTYFLPTKAPQVKLLNASLQASQVTAGKLLHRVNPVFPAFAKTAGIHGSVVIAATIGKDGRLRNMRLISGNGALALEAFRAARQWVYAPYRLDGQPIEVDARIVMEFGNSGSSQP